MVPNKNWCYKIFLRVSVPICVPKNPSGKIGTFTSFSCFPKHFLPWGWTTPPFRRTKCPYKDKVAKMKTTLGRWTMGGISMVSKRCRITITIKAVLDYFCQWYDLWSQNLHIFSNRAVLKSQPNHFPIELVELHLNNMNKVLTKTLQYLVI